MSVLTPQEIRSELQDLESNQERLEYLVELGDTLPEFPQSSCTEDNRVLGCQSMVWLIARFEKGKLFFQATSDAPMVRGLIAILLATYSERTPAEILSFPFEPFLKDVGLQSFLSPMRSNGLHSMVQRIRQIAIEATAGAANEVLAEPSPAKVIPKRSLDSIRDDFPILARTMEGNHPLVYLDNAASSQRPLCVIEQMSVMYQEHYANAHRSGHQLASEITIAMEDARAAVQQFIHASHSEEVIFTSGTTASINLVARAWGDANVKQGDEILLSELEHHSNIVPWQQLAERTGAKVRWIPLGDNYQLDLRDLSQWITARTKVVSIAAVSNVLGAIMPVRLLADAVHRVGGILVVDAAQAVPHGSIDVAAWDADFVAFGAHKMMGPSGIGALYGRRSLLESMPPFLGGGGMIQTVTKEGFTAATLPFKFEAGTPPSVEAAGFKVAIDYLNTLGQRELLNHERRLVNAAESILKTIPGLQVYGPPIHERTGIVTFAVEGIHSDMIGRMLDAEGIAIRVGHHCAIPLHTRLGIPVTCRASFYAYNTMDEAIQFGNAVKAICERLRKS